MKAVSEAMETRTTSGPDSEALLALLAAIVTRLMKEKRLTV
jgi:hypothetical protein